MSEDEERALVDGLARSDPNAISTFIERTHAPVYRMTSRFTQELELRQDWTHDTLLRVLEELARGYFVYQWPGCFWSWFAKRARFLLLDQVERLRRERASDEVDSDDTLARLPASPLENPEQQLEAMEARRIVEHCIENLQNPDHQRALRLHLLEELSYEDIAVAMTTRLNTVRSFLRRARIAVRRCVASSYGWEQPEQNDG